ncbi:hypothetical protein ALC53_12003 [Atta colombica]|uniref:Uncharacterized protein n=1 Tax=Atta colombica TaxID=520822 RepID=A0A151HZD2_9HYME|nr:hypothetical protein ALC53_12003 [Atta colombica]
MTISQCRDTANVSNVSKNGTTLAQTMSGNFYPKTTLGHLQDNVGPTLAVCQQLVVMLIMKRRRVKLCRSTFNLTI